MGAEWTDMDGNWSEREAADGWGQTTGGGAAVDAANRGTAAMFGSLEYCEVPGVSRLKTPAE